MSKRKFTAPDPLEPPPRWLHCPRKANSLLMDKFLAFKVPLSSKFDSRVPIECRFTFTMLIDSLRRNYSEGTGGAKRLGLVVDLTNTTRFYDADAELKQHGIKYVKINCRGHGETPSPETTKLFMNVVETYIRQHPLDVVGVHCTHGYNRTGFLICAYMVEMLDYAVDMALAMFAEARPPGIYKQDYVNELYKRYAGADQPVPHAPPLPNWDADNDSQQSDKTDGQDDDDEDGDDAEEEDGVEGDGDSEPADEHDNEKSGDQQHKQQNNLTTRGQPSRLAKRRRRGTNQAGKLNPVFAMPELVGVEPVLDLAEASIVRTQVGKLCGWQGEGFAGAQPVSMEQRNVRYIVEHPYMVSWKADGTRYLMYIGGRGRVFMLDRDNSVFRVSSLSFPQRKDLDAHLQNTLLDGEFVVDIEPSTGGKIPRYLIYDIVRFEKDDVGKMNFHVRMQCIAKEIVGTRNEAIKCGKLDKSAEAMSVRQKQFYPLADTRKLLSDEFKKQLPHGIDGLIFQPVDVPYAGGRCDTMLKWKPSELNSVDFRLEISVRQEVGGLPEKIGELYVLGYDKPFSQIKVNKHLGKLHQKIIECSWGPQGWEFMRERLDKSYPNHYTTAVAVCESIKNPITSERLLGDIAQIELRRNKAAKPAT
jgi:mRNA-capping enzyme